MTQETFKTAAETICWNFKNLGYTVVALVEDDVPKFQCTNTPDNSPELVFTTIEEDGTFVFDCTLHFQDITLDGAYADSVEYILNELTRLGKVVTEVRSFRYDPELYEK